MLQSSRTQVHRARRRCRRVTAPIDATSPLPRELRFVPQKLLRPQPNLRKADELLPPVSGRVGILPHNLPADPSVGEEQSHIYAQVGRAKFLEEPFCLHELRPNAVGIPPLDVDESAGVKDQAVVEVAPGLAPGRLQHLVTLPECFLIEEFHESFERGREGGRTGTHNATVTRCSPTVPRRRQIHIA